MLRDFERRLADVLGANLPAPSAGAVDVLPGAAQSQVLVSVRHAEPVAHDFLASRREQVPGADALRRILRLRANVGLDVRQRQGQSRDVQLGAFDALLYFVDDPAFRSGRALDGGAADPGFFLHALTLQACDPPAAITLQAEGFFWPVGVAGETGEPIVRVRTRIAVEPLLLEPAAPRLVAGGPTIDLVIRFGAGASEIGADGVDPRPFGNLVLRLTDAGGRPGAGALGGGATGPDGSRLVAPVEGAASFQYTPPAEPAIDLLHVSFDDGEGGAGDEIGRLLLTVRGT